MNRPFSPSALSTAALCSAVPFASGDAVPEWINLLPAGQVMTVDGRGPYTVASMAALIAASLQDGDKLALDENHATDKGAVLGLPAPARGWIVALEEREGGLWGKVDWTPTGRQLMEDKAYKGVSPVILHDVKNRVGRVLRASLTNTPNLHGLVSLHSENLTENGTMDWKAKLIELLGLDSSADDAAISAALAAKMAAPAEKALCGQDLLVHPAVVALQGQLTSQAQVIADLTNGQARRDATAFVDAAIREGRVGVKPLRDDYIALHMQDPARAEKLIGGMPRVAGLGVASAVLSDDGGDRGLVAEDRQVMALFGVSEDDMKAALKRDGLIRETL